MRHHGMARTIGLATVALVVVGFGLYIVTRPVVAWPTEARRVVHPGGFSLVVPPDWEHFVAFADGRHNDLLRLLPSKAVGNTGEIVVNKLAVAVTPQGLAKKRYVNITFQGRPAYALESENKFARDHARGYVFERDGVWFDMTVRGPQVEPLDSGVWLAYAESFRVEPVRAAPPTQPATDLSVTP